MMSCMYRETPLACRAVREFGLNWGHPITVIENYAKSVGVSAKSIQQVARCIEVNAKSIHEDAKSLEDNSKSFHPTS